MLKNPPKITTFIDIKSQFPDILSSTVIPQWLQRYFKESSAALCPLPHPRSAGIVWVKRNNLVQMARCRTVVFPPSYATDGLLRFSHELAVQGPCKKIMSRAWVNFWHRSSPSSSPIPSPPISPASRGTLRSFGAAGQAAGGSSCWCRCSYFLNRDFWQLSAPRDRRCVRRLVSHFALVVSHPSIHFIIPGEDLRWRRLKWRGAPRSEARTSCAWGWQGRRDVCGWQQRPSPLVSHTFRGIWRWRKNREIFFWFVCFIFSRLPALRILCYSGSCTAWCNLPRKKHLTGPTLGLLYTLIVVHLACRADWWLMMIRYRQPET